MTKGNGSKIWIPTGMVGLVLMTCFSFGVLNNKVENNVDAIKRNTETPIKVGKIETAQQDMRVDISELKDSVNKIEVEQKIMQREMNAGFMEVLKEIKIAQ